ncbi:hypothetical protein DIURU_001697 [Diutina rugosa]|uniref:non-specific serine/threonine protein kinase n=1 Tax=Diutina rugosa TaxID=5481 RepID=A0A642UYJ8_DIURU|nr:uncharacterized protein DIURU_001697 [Diutina rugosa]KAA8905269.1 hypothetical protein DIURU_001697 [Diutina rugosa]
MSFPGTNQSTGTVGTPVAASRKPGLAKAVPGSNSGGGGNVVGVNYRVGKKIGEGSFGILFEGVNVLTQTPVAIKFEPRKCEAPQLRDEYRSYRILAGTKGIPQAYFFGQEGVHNILIIDLLGPSLEDLFGWCDRKLSVSTVVLVAKQMIRRVQAIHEHHLIYRDIKPDNFLIGRPGTPGANLVYVVDFGMAKQYRNPKTKVHIPYREKKALSGTARYMSINTHLGREQSRRDDLESLGHVFMYFLRGQLPWQGLKAPTNKQKYEKIGLKKQSTSIQDLCKQYPVQFAQYLTYVRNLKFEETPDYDYLVELIDKADAGQSGDESDEFYAKAHYDWMDLNGGRGWDLALNKKANIDGYDTRRQRRMPSGNANNIHSNYKMAQQHLRHQQQQLHNHQVSNSNKGYGAVGEHTHSHEDGDVHSEDSEYQRPRKGCLRRLFFCF